MNDLFASGATSRYVRIGNAYVPAHPRRLRAAVSRAGGPEPLRRHVARQGYAAAAAARSRFLGAVELADGALREQLGELFGCEVWISVHLGPPRANRKPVMLIRAVGDRRHRVIGVAKFGHSPLTKSLAVNEAVSLIELTEVDGLGSSALRLPRLLAKLPWGNGLLIVQSAVAFRGRHRVPSVEKRLRAEWLIAGAPGDTFDEYLTSLHARLREVEETPDRLLRAFDRATDVCADETLVTGRWHGDWSPQNVVRTPDGVGAWDFERFGDGVPAGFDSLHFRMQSLVRAGDRPGQQLVDEAPEILAPWQEVAPAVSRGVSVLLLLELAARYVGDGQAEHPGSPGALAPAWVADAEEALS